MARMKTVVIMAAATLALSCGGNKTAQREAQAAAGRGYETVTTPAADLEGLKRTFESGGVPSGIGIGESTDEQIARNAALDEARSEVANSIDVQVQRLSETYAQNIDGEAKKLWEEGVRQITNQHLRGSKAHKEIVQFNKNSNRYKIYALMVLDPKLFKNAVAEATAHGEELELRVKKDEMMKKLDENIATYQRECGCQ